ncbi:MAG: beta strand repeat-containing protein, partial [Burkholderiales bacterium]
MAVSAERAAEQAPAIDLSAGAQSFLSGAARQTVHVDIGASGAALDTMLRIAEVGETEVLQWLDNASGSVLGEQALEGDIHVAVTGSDLGDVLVVDIGAEYTLHKITVAFDGGKGEDKLTGPQGDMAWDITGTDAGAAGLVSFNDVEYLQGAADNEDTFTIFDGGDVSGLIDGGAGGFDSLVLAGGSFASVVYNAISASAGTIERDGDVLAYAGLEPIFDNLSVTDRVIRTSNLTDNARLTDLGTQLTLASTDAIPTFESVTFAKPTSSLTINLGGDLGIPIVSDTDRLEIQALALNADLIVNGEAGKDEVTITGSIGLSGNPLTINAETINVDPGVTVTAGDIALNALATVGSLATPDTLPLANVAAAIDIDGASLTGDDIALTATASLVSDLTNPLPNIPAATLVANVSAEIAITGAASITAAGAFTANAASNVNSTVLANAATVPVAGELAIASPVINTTARSRLLGNATVAAGGDVMLDAATSTIVNATADGIMATTAVGTTTAIPVIVATTQASIQDAAAVTASDTLTVHAAATGMITTTANSTPAGAAANPATLATLGIATAAGPQTDAAAIAATTLTSNTRAFADTSGSLVTAGALALLAESDFDLTTAANATPTVSLDNNGFAVAVNFTQIIDEAFIDGTPTITAASADIHTGGGSNLVALARSGAAGLDQADAGINAGSFALNTNIPGAGPIQGNLSHAYIASGAVVTFAAPTDLTIAAQNTSITDISAEPQGAATIAVELGVGRSVAANISAYTTLASIDGGVALNGVRDLSLTADGDQTALVTALAGSLAGIDASAQTVAASITGNGSEVLIDAGATMVLAGTLTARANHKGTSIVRASSNAAAAAGEEPSESLAAPIAVNLANDVASATVDGSVTAAGAIVIAADADIENEAESVAGVHGADPDETNAADLVAAEIAFLANRANLAFGGAPVPPTTDPDVNTQSLTELAANHTQGKAAALAVNLSTAASNAAVLA